MKKAILTILMGLTTISANADIICDHGIYTPFQEVATVAEKADGSLELRLDLSDSKDALMLSNDGVRFLDWILKGEKRILNEIVLRYAPGDCVTKGKLVSCYRPDSMEIEVNGKKRTLSGSQANLEIRRLTSESATDFQLNESFEVSIGAIGTDTFSRCTLE